MAADEVELAGDMPRLLTVSKRRTRIRDVSGFVRRAASVAGVIAFVAVSTQATGRVDAAQHSSAAALSSTQARECSTSWAQSKCPPHVYKVRIRASASTKDDETSQSGSYDLVARVEVRYGEQGRRGSYPPTVALAAGLKRPKLLSFRGSGTYSDAVCSVRTKLRAGPISGSVAGNPSRIHRSGATPRIVYYSLSIGIGPTQNSPEPKPSPPPFDCPGEGGANTSFEKRLRSSDYNVQIDAYTSPIFGLRWDFYRPQAKGRMEFPLNRLAAGKRFELRLSGRNPYAMGSSKGTAHVVFVPVR